LFSRQAVLVSLFLLPILSLPAQPTLGTASAGNQSVLYWPSTPTNFILQSATNLASPQWVTANDAVTVTAVTVSNTSPSRFFRLISATPPTGMVLIPQGSFLMGNTIGDSDITDASNAMVNVSAFYMDANAVTSNLWQTIYDYAISNGYSFTNSGAATAGNHPIQTVNWYDCVAWCNARSQSEGLTPAYYMDAGFTQIYTNSFTTDVFANWSANGYRLPTEAEWEKAARGGLNARRFPWGNLISESQANYQASTNVYSYDLGPDGTNAVGLAAGFPYTSPVGSFDVNGYGLYDMAGNVFSWCWDWYGAPPYLPGSPYLGGNDPHGPPAGASTRRVLRGGSSTFGAAALARTAARNSFRPAITTNSIGFRCVLPLNP
jgi:formylglycine-generating enzyme required for sulfatase activity